MDQNPVSVSPADQQAVVPAADGGIPPVSAAPKPAADATAVPELPTDELIGAIDEALEPLPEIALNVAEKVAEAQNVLVALSSDPSVDEMAAAIGLSLFLDKLGKRATAIYSGTTPNALQFLKPEETFETSADTLQDFVIALNKDKADHLRYKLDGNYVKIFITPYKTRVSREDLSFSYGDYNVDLVLALDVANGIDLDSALREHGRIMHDAVIVNITTGNPGKLGEIEWSDKRASSVSEMVAKMLYGVSRDKVEKDEATAFLTGIVAATNRFSNAKTTPETMQVAALLMRSGANQQLISKNITPDVDNELLVALKDTAATVKTVDKADAVGDKVEQAAEMAESSAEEAEPAPAEELIDPTELSVSHDLEVKSEPEASVETEIETENVAVNETEKPAEPQDDTSSLLADLKEAEENLAKAGDEALKAEEPQPDTSGYLETEEAAKSEETPEQGDATTPEPEVGPTAEEEALMRTDPEKVLQPSSDLAAEAGVATGGSPTSSMNPAATAAPEVATKPEINGVPEMNFALPADAEILPPPPVPPIDVGAPGSMPPGVPTPEALAAPFEPAAPADTSAPLAAGAPVASEPDATGVTAADLNPSAFRIPGM